MVIATMDASANFSGGFMGGVIAPRAKNTLMPNIYVLKKS